MPTEKLQVEFKREMTGYDEDIAVVTMHFQSATGGLLDDTIRQAVEAEFGSMWNIMLTQLPPNVLLHSFRWYDQQVWPTPSPLLRVNDTVDIPGTGTGTALPPQCSVSITLQTDVRARWGRFYMPGPLSASLVSQTGRLTTTAVDTWATAARDMIQGAKDQGAYPHVWSPKGGVGPPAFSAGTTVPVTSVRVDDVVDIIRSRRWQSNPYRKVFPIT